MNTAAHRHPLATLLDQKHWTYETFLRKVSARHKARACGTLATRKEKVTRWIAGIAVPNTTTQVAMADVFGIPEEEVHARGWPYWLLAAFNDDCTILESPWTPAGTLQALDEVGGPVDRRGFLITTTTALSGMITDWALAEPAQAAVTGGRRVGRQVADLFDSRLYALRHLDDQVGSSRVYDAATAELRLITRLLKESSHTEQIGRRLYSAAAEASRLAGWCAYDSGHDAAAERHFVAALRAAGSAADLTASATVMAFHANVLYTAGNPRGALGLLDTALGTSRQITSPRVIAMLYARQARAHSKAGETTAAYRAADEALAVYGKAGPLAEDLPSMYWLTAGELNQVAGSAALTLGDPHRALAYFDDAVNGFDPYDGEKEARGTAIYLARRAEAHLVLGELDAAVEVAEQVVHLLGGVDSARGTDALHDLRVSLSQRKDVSAVSGFLDLTSYGHD